MAVISRRALRKTVIGALGLEASKEAASVWERADPEMKPLCGRSSCEQLQAVDAMPEDWAGSPWRREGKAQTQIRSLSEVTDYILFLTLVVTAVSVTNVQHFASPLGPGHFL